MINLPKPGPDPQRYPQMIERGFRRFPERRANYEKCKNSVRGLVVDHLPILMDFEVVSRCNFRCPTCLVSEWPHGRRAADMPLSAFRSLLDRLYGLIEIKLQGVGEPLLHPQIFDMVALAAERDIWTRLTTNGSLLHVNENYRRLVDSDPGEVQISIDGATKEVFEAVRPGSDFELVVRNATLLNGYEQELNLLRTRSWTLVQKANLAQLKDIVRLGARMKFRRMTFSLAISCFGMEGWTEKNQPLDASGGFSRELGEELLEIGAGYGIEISFWDAGSKYLLNAGPGSLCAWLWERAFIASDLRIVPCCVLSNPEFLDLGDAMEFEKVWNGEAYRHLRQSHLDGTLPAFCNQCYGE